MIHCRSCFGPSYCDLMHSLRGQDTDIWEDSGILDRWQLSFDCNASWFDIRPTTPTAFVDKLGMCGFQSMVTFDAAEYNNDSDDHYISLNVGDWICPRTDFWVNDPTTGWQIVDEDAWTAASTFNPHSGTTDSGWLPADYVRYSMQNQHVGTYASLQLGRLLTPLPIETHPCIQGVDDLQPNCHCTILYGPHLSSAALQKARKEGNLLLHKFCRDGHVPIYVARPHECIDDAGNTFLSGCCKYSSRFVARNTRDCINAFPLMRFAEVAVRNPFSRLIADFDHIHVRCNPTTCSTSIVGSLDKNCNVHDLVGGMKDFLENEVLGQNGNPDFSSWLHHWSKPHITLSKARYK